MCTCIMGFLAQKLLASPANGGQHQICLKGENSRHIHPSGLTGMKFVLMNEGSQS